MGWVVSSFTDGVEPNLIPVQNGGFVLLVTLKCPLLVPVIIQLLYTDAETGSQALMSSTSTYYNMSALYHIAVGYQIPYDVFYLGVALFYMDLEGPMVQLQNSYSEYYSYSIVPEITEGFSRL